MDMKKIIVFAAGAVLIASAGAVSYAQTQTGSVGASVGVSGSGYAPPATIVSPPTPIAPPPSDGGFIQFNNLTVQSVSGTNPPAEILATNDAIMPMMGAATPPGAAGISNPSASASAGTGTCYKFDSENSRSGTAVACPSRPPIAASSTTSGTVSGNAGNAPAPMMYPYPYPIRYQPYRIEIGPSTQLYLRDRTTATLGDFAPGDQINVFGYYNTDGTIQAYLVRDLSKPVQNEFLQLNNVDLVSISANGTPATLVVVQQSGYPCYGYGAGGIQKQTIACPMGTTQNLTAPSSALAPTWSMLRKYVVNIDAKTIILDSNRTTLGLSDLQIGDALNIYGETSDNGQTLNADIVRDLSIPAQPSTYSGKVTQVNADGSFVIRTTDGRTITVQSPIQVGATLQLTGILDRLQNVLSQVTSIINGSIFAVPGMLRIQGGIPLPAGPGGTPNTKN